MENKELDFAKLWHAQQTTEPDIKDLQLKIAKYKKENVRKQIFANINLILTLSVLILIWVNLDQLEWSSKLGLSLIILAICISLFKFNKFYRKFNKLDQGTDSNTYLQKLLQIQVEQKNIQHKFINTYFIILGIGLAIYLWQFAVLLGSMNGIMIYAATFLWLGFVWFYLRPRITKKQEAKLNALIEQVQSQINQVDI
ncbi:hypothetical protein GCM10022216_15570 [Sphingobacterium kyonggiense]|uniref:2TM domain-containing protein n=1 Tax=Sphingobacterium kyonggiense TaxID=714075 RepID=A0ABP7YMG1_9SPHI